MAEKQYGARSPGTDRLDADGRPSEGLAARGSIEDESVRLRRRSPRRFPPFLAESQEQVLDLRAGNFTHFDNVVSVKSGSVSLTRKPEELVFLSAKPQTTGKAPWLTL